VVPLVAPMSPSFLYFTTIRATLVLFQFEVTRDLMKGEKARQVAIKGHSGGVNTAPVLWEPNW
jgi:hypothetical protein